MARLSEPKRDELDLEGQRAYDAIVASRGQVAGPFGVLLHYPALAERVAALGETLRFHGRLSAVERELATLTAGREAASAYEWAAHEPLARRAGVRPEAIDVIRTGAGTDALEPREALIVETVRAMCREHKLSDARYAQAVEALGPRGLIELAVLAGYYTMISFVLNTFEVDLPAGAPPVSFAR